MAANPRTVDRLPKQRDFQRPPKSRPLFFLGVVVLVLGGCAAKPELVPPDLSKATLDLAWVLDGRLSVKTPNDGWHGGIRWTHTAAQDRLMLSGPLGTGAVSLVISKAGTFLRRADGSQEFSRDASSLLEREIGLPLPLKAFSSWVRGKPFPELTTSDQIQKAGDTTGFSQAGWHIRYLEFGPEYPMRLVVENESYQLRLVIGEWGGTPD